MTIVKTETSASSEKFFVHLENGEDNEDVFWFAPRGIAADRPRDALRTLQAMGGGRRLKHHSISPAPGCEWSEAQWDRAWQVLEDEFGLRGVPRVRVRHKKKRAGTDKASTHEHAAFPAINPETGKALRFSYEYARQEKVARILEIEFAEPFTRGRHNKAVIAALINDGRYDVADAMIAAGLVTRERPLAKRTHAEHQQAKRTRSSPEDDRVRIWSAWKSAVDGAPFQKALETQGMVVAAGDKAGAVVVVTLAGAVYELGRALRAHAKAHHLAPPRARDLRRLTPISALPSVADAKTRVRLLEPPLGDDLEWELDEDETKPVSRGVPLAPVPGVANEGRDGEAPEADSTVIRGARRARPSPEKSNAVRKASSWWDWLRDLKNDPSVGAAIESVMSSDDGAAVDVRLTSNETLHAEGDEIGVEWAGNRVGNDTIRVFVVMVQRAGWPGVYLTGDEDWCRRAAIALAREGIPVTNPDLQSVIAPYQRSNVSSAVEGARRGDSATRPSRSADQRRAAAEFETDVQTYDKTVQREGAADGMPGHRPPWMSEDRRSPVLDREAEQGGHRRKSRVSPSAEDHRPRAGRPMAESLSGTPRVEDERESFAQVKARVSRDLIVATIQPFDPDDHRPRLPLNDRKLLRQGPVTPADPAEPSPPSARPSRGRSRDDR